MYVKRLLNTDFYKRLTRILLLFFICDSCKLTAVEAASKVRLRDVEVLTLYNGKMTNGRRGRPIPQLKCTGGSAGCSAFTPHAVQCYNKGWDGYDVQWECKTDMDNKYRFGHIQVSCEGYDYPDDPYVLRGSCGLEYTIELTEEGYDRQRSSDNGWNNYHHQYPYNRHSSRSSYQIGDLVMLVILGGIFYMIYSTCARNHSHDTGTAPRPYAHETNPGSEYPQGPGAQPPPPYSPDEPGFRKEYTQGSAPPPYSEEPGFRRQYTEGAAGSASSASSTGTSNSGFWTGAATGGLLGYLFGGRNAGTRYHHNPYYSGWSSPYTSDPYYRDTGGWFGNWFGGGRSSYGYNRPSNYSYGSSSFGSSSRSSSGSRTTSGMGGTSRR